MSQPVNTNFDFDLKLHETTQQKRVRSNIIQDEEERQLTSATTDLLHYHHKFGHVSFQKLQEMAKIGTIPKILAKC